MAGEQPYRAFRHFVALAGQRTEPWRTTAGIAIYVLCAFSLLPMVVEAFLSPAAYERLRDGNTPGMVVARLAITGFDILILAMLVRRLHGRPARSLIGDPIRAAEGFVSSVFLCLALLLTVYFLPPWIVEDYELRRWWVWALWLIPAVPMLFIQVTSEEMFFRGYIQQQLAAKSQSRLVWMILPSVLFGLPHFFNGATPVEGVMAIIATGFVGLACADLTARHGTIGPAIGLHMAYNAIAILVFGVETRLMSGLALIFFKVPDVAMPDLGSPESIALIIVGSVMTGMTTWTLWLTARFAIRR